MSFEWCSAGWHHSVEKRCLFACVGYFAVIGQLQAQNNPPDPEQMFRQLDADQNGSITMEEQRGPGTREFAQRVFEMAKKPATGSISKEEFLRIAEQHRNGGRSQPGGSRGPGPRPGLDAGTGRPPRSNNGRPAGEPGELPPEPSSLLRGVDENGDQKLSRAELRRLVERFDTLDINKDGDLDLAELTTDRNSDAEETPSTDSGSPESQPKSSNATPSGNSKPETRGGGSGRGSTAGKKSSEKPATNKSATGKSSVANPSANSREPLTGVWRGWVVDGRGQNPDAGHMEMELTVIGNRMTARELGANRRAQEGLGAGTFVVSAQGNSGNLDANQTAGQHAGREYRGIFELEGDTLKWCVGGRGTTRPSEFETGRGNYLMILHKQK